MSDFGAAIRWYVRVARKPNFAPLPQNADGQALSAYLWKSRRKAEDSRPGAPLPIGRPSIRTTGMTIWLAEVTKASRAA
jgi:hypothetical protein